MAWSGEVLPEEMVAEILAKFSAKLLVRMTCICKAWHDLIMTNRYPNLTNILKHHYSAVTFFRRWILDDQDNHTFEDSLITHDSRNPSSLEFQRLHDIEAYDQVCGACNGILLCLKQDTFYLHNPITREVLPLLPPILPRMTDECGDIGCLENGFNAFFGFDSSNNDYKIILFRFGLFDRVIKTYVDTYKTSTNCWSKLDVEFEFGNYIPRYGCQENEGVFLKGFFHGLEYKHKHATPTGPERILTLDFVLERFGVIEFPRCSRKKPRNWHGQCLAVLDDSLALCLTRKKSETDEIWVMTEYGKEESWTKKFSIKLSGEIPADKVCTFWACDTSLVVLSGHCDESEDFDDTKGRWFASLQDQYGEYRELNEHRGCHLTGFGFRPSAVSICSPRS